MSKELDIKIAIKIDEVALITEAQKVVCSNLCPSVKKEGERWTHVETCRALRAWLLYNHEVVIDVSV